MCDYEVISHEPVRLWRSTPPHGSSGCHWLVTMCLCLIDCEMVCWCTAVSHLRPTKVIDWFGHVECSHLDHSNAFFSHSWITSTGRRIVGLGRRQRPSENIFPFTPPPPHPFPFYRAKGNSNRPSQGTWLCREEINAMRKSTSSPSYRDWFSEKISYGATKDPEVLISNVSSHCWHHSSVCNMQNLLFSLSFSDPSLVDSSQFRSVCFNWSIHFT